MSVATFDDDAAAAEAEENVAIDPNDGEAEGEDEDVNEGESVVDVAPPLLVPSGSSRSSSSSASSASNAAGARAMGPPVIRQATPLPLASVVRTPITSRVGMTEALLRTMSSSATIIPSETVQRRNRLDTAIESLASSSAPSSSNEPPQWLLMMMQAPYGCS